MRTHGSALLALACLVALLSGPSALAAAPGAPPAPPDPAGRPAAASVGEVIVDTERLDFGQLQVGSHSAPRFATVENSSGAAVTVAASIVGTARGDFELTGGTCRAGTLAAGATCRIGVVFAPRAEYVRLATLHITSDASTLTDVALEGTGLIPPSHVAWGPLHGIGGQYTYETGTALARTRTTTGEYLHSVVERYDTARRGIYYRRGTAALAWTNAIRLNPSTQHGVQATIAASGGRVFVAWVELTTANPAGTRPRSLWFRRNVDSGAAGAWSAPIRLTSATGRIDRPRIAASGPDIYIAYTDADTGLIRLTVSHDAGVTWRTISLGGTALRSTSGRTGTPVVAASGMGVAVAWFTSYSAGIMFRSSVDRGGTWIPTTSVGRGAMSGTWASIAMSGTRVALGWPTSTGFAVRVRTGTTWGTVHLVRPSAGSTRPYAAYGTGAIALYGSTRLAVAFEACWDGCGVNDTDPYRSDVVWRESATNGSTWARSQTVISGTGGYASVDLPSVVWPNSTNRYVVASRWSETTLAEVVSVTRGTGTP